MRPLAPELARTSPLAPKMTPVIKIDHFLDVIEVPFIHKGQMGWAVGHTKTDEFSEKLQQGGGGGGISNPYPNPNHIADSGPLNRAF